MAQAPVVVVGCRDTTPGVRIKIERILRNRLDFKSVFVRGDDQVPAVLQDRSQTQSPEREVLAPVFS